MLSRRRPPPPSQQVVSFVVFLCVAGGRSSLLTAGEGGGGSLGFTTSSCTYFIKTKMKFHFRRCTAQVHIEEKIDTLSTLNRNANLVFPTHFVK
jgi:hypothetical protein